MARLGEGSSWLIQQQEGFVVLFHEHTEEEVVRFDPADANATARAQKDIYDDTRLTDEETCFANFWSGYFYAHAGGMT